MKRRMSLSFAVIALCATALFSLNASADGVQFGRIEAVNAVFKSPSTGVLYHQTWTTPEAGPSQECEALTQSSCFHHDLRIVEKASTIYCADAHILATQTPTTQFLDNGTWRVLKGYPDGSTLFQPPSYSAPRSGRKFSMFSYFDYAPSDSSVRPAEILLVYTTKWFTPSGWRTGKTGWEINFY